MGHYKGRYGLSSEEVMIMKSKFQKVKLSGATDWKDLNDFCKWAVEEGFKPGMRIKKRYSFMPHGIDNSYFVEPGQDEPDRNPAFIDAKSPFCLRCNTDCNVTEIGCKKWREYFVENWNKNICRINRPAARSTDEVWRYEHPDLVREGIVFEGSCSV